MKYLFSTLYTQIINTSFWEWMGVVFSILQCLFTYFNSILLFPAGTVVSLIYLYLFLFPKIGHPLYADASLSIYYIVINFIGWFAWKKNKTSDNTIQSNLNTISNKKDWSNAILLFIILGGIIYAVLHNFTNSDVPLLDSCTAAFSWVAAWLVTKRKVENWLWAIASVVISIPMLIYKNYALTAVYSLMLLIMYIAGYIKWRKEAADTSTDNDKNELLPIS